MISEESNPYLGYARSFQALMDEGRNLPYGGFQPSVESKIESKGPVVLVLSPAS